MMALTEAQKETVELLAKCSQSPENAIFRTLASSKVPVDQSADFYQGVLEMSEAILNLLKKQPNHAIIEKVVISLAGVAAERLLDAFPAEIEPSTEVK